jgi:serine/threonine protein kinase/tetratricopeptide (TPR) repeat protein
MTLHPGAHLGPYEILSPIGAGGMGEVYRARDSKLGRDVAIKVLPPAFAEDADRLRRFHQEARILAALSHPNVVQVFGVGEHEGAPYLVMELVEGETLRQRLGKGRLPWRKAVELAAAVADGMAAAHAKGIFHRDLKPENLVLSEHGHVKILDFGLAKPPFETLGEAATVGLVTPGTMDGTLVGTVGYMAPEQVQAQPADARSDIFALGCVLYELVTGKRAFARSTAVETLAAILKDPAPEASLDPSRGTAELDRILHHCLEKAPADRFQSAKDLAFQLRALTATAGVAGPGSPPSRRWRLVATGLLGLALGAGLLTWAPWRRPMPPFDARRVAILPFENRTGEAALDSLGQEVVDLVRQDLQQVDNLKVAADAVVPAGSDPGMRLAAATRAHFVASGAYYLRNDAVELQARIVDPWSGKVVYTLGPWRGPRADPAPALAELRQVLGGALAWTYDEAFRFEPGATRPPRLEALLALRKDARSFGRDYATYLSSAQQALALDPDFFVARLTIVFALQNQGRFEEVAPHVTRMEADYGHLTPVERAHVRCCRAVLEGRPLEALKAFEDLRAIHPDTYWTRYVRALYEVAVNRTGSAIRSLRGLPPTWMGEGVFMDFWPANDLCEAYHQAGDYAAELRTARSAQVPFPDVLTFRAHEVNALVALGRLQELEPIFQATPTVTRRPGTLTPSEVMQSAVQELRAHGHREASTRLAARLLGDLRSQSPEAQKPLRASVVTLLIHLDRGAEALELVRALAAENPGDVSLQGRFGALLARLGRGAEARQVEADLAALDRPYLYGRHSYGRACIAAQLGERDRAMRLLGQALGQGYRFSVHLHRDVDLEPLRGHPAFEALLRPRD